MSKRENYDAKVQEIQKNQKKLKEKMQKLSASKQQKMKVVIPRDSGGVMEGARDSMNLVGEYLCQMENAKGGVPDKYNIEECADQKDLPHPGKKGRATGY